MRPSSYFWRSRIRPGARHDGDDRLRRGGVLPAVVGCVECTSHKWTRTGSRAQPRGWPRRAGCRPGQAASCRRSGRRHACRRAVGVPPEPAERGGTAVAQHDVRSAPSASIGLRAVTPGLPAGDAVMRRLLMAGSGRANGLRMRFGFAPIRVQIPEPLPVRPGRLCAANCRVQRVVPPAAARPRRAGIQTYRSIRSTTDGGALTGALLTASRGPEQRRDGRVT